ncbi:MAG TPA: diguanylate cyclase [Candidatus Limnocylindria bacterium]|nr:diguanylate cyclase [Candidatus Limnocylindria bacterium]
MSSRLHAVALRAGTTRAETPPMTISNVPRWAGSIAIGVGLVALAGWILGIEILKSMVPGVIAMKANTAICLVLLGGAVVLLSRDRDRPGRRWPVIALAGTAGAIAVMTGAQFFAGGDFGIDHLLFREAAGQVGTVTPGRMAPATVITLVALAISAIVAPRAPRAVIVLCTVALALAYLNLLDYLFGASVPTFLAGYTQMAVNTAVAVGILSVGLLARLGPANPFAPLGGHSSAAVLLRRLLVVTVGVPVAVAWLRLEGQRLGLYDTSFGTSLMVVAITILSLMAIIHSARWASVLEARRVASDLERDRFFELSLDLLAVFDADGRFMRVNPSWESTLGYPAAELIGRPLFDLIHPEDLERTQAAAQAHFVEGRRVQAFQNRYRHRDGTYRWLEWMSRMSPDNSLAFSVARDVTERKAAEEGRQRRNRVLETRNETLSQEAIRDPLTGLHNRRFFEVTVARLERRWTRSAARAIRPVAVVMFDLDNFGQLNKLHGHQAGDAVLRLFAGILKKRFRDSDLVARYGGEEFVALVEGATAGDAVRIAEEVRGALETAAIDIGTDEPIRATVSAGCAGLGDDRNVSHALSVADVWLSQAKRSGRNQVVGL